MWLVSTGFWDDDGVWDDAEFWTENHDDVFIVASQHTDTETFRTKQIGSPSGWFVRIS